MDLELKQAACAGNAVFLKAVASKPNHYFLTQHTPLPDEDKGAAGNILHLAAWHGKYDFIREALDILPLELVVKLLNQLDKDYYNPFQTAAMPGPKSLEIVRLILGFYRKNSGAWPSGDNINDNRVNKPWFALTPLNCTALHLAIDDSGLEPETDTDNENCSLAILEMDMEFFLSKEDDSGTSALFLAVKHKCSQVAEKILNSSCFYSINGPDGSTPLHFAPYCSENVSTLLLRKHQNLINAVDNNGYNVLHQWAEIGNDCSIKIILEGDFPTAKTKLFDGFIYATEKKKGDSPLHLAARNNNTEIAKAFILGYDQVKNVRSTTQEIGAHETPESLDRPPWRIKNKLGNTPLHVALFAKCEEVALYFLTFDRALCQVFNNRGESPLFLAVAAGLSRVVDKILEIQYPSFSMLRRNDGTTVLHCLRCSPGPDEELGKKIFQKFWWMMNLTDDKFTTALDRAKVANKPWLIALLTTPSIINKEPFDWKTACENGETSAVFAYISACEDLQTVYRKENDTPLHHIKLTTYTEYMNFLQIPSIAELKNATDSTGATPLHRALKRKDKPLARALLTDRGVERNIKDFNVTDPTTAMDLLAKLCIDDKDWEKMCELIKVNPYLKTTYIQPSTNLDQMRNTLAVVAALLVAITFAPIHALPGGLKSDGNAMQASKPAFLVFLLADTFGLCTATLVLFCLIWSMVAERDMSNLLIDRSIWMLLFSLYGTMVAYMASAYTVLEKDVLWATIIVIVMCSVIMISVSRTILCNVLARFIPSAYEDHRGNVHSREQVNPATSANIESPEAGV